MASPKGDEITPRFPDDASYLTRNQSAIKSSDQGELSLMKAAVMTGESLSGDAESETARTDDHWDVPFMPGLQTVPEDDLEMNSAHCGDTDFEHPSSAMHLSLQEFLPPSNSSLAEGSSDYYKRHDSFRSLDSCGDLTGSNSFNTFGAAMDAAADGSSSVELKGLSTLSTHKRQGPAPIHSTLLEPDSPQNPTVPTDAISHHKKSSPRTDTKGAQVLTFRPPTKSPPLRTPPKVKKLNFSFLEPPSPIPIRSSIAESQRQPHERSPTSLRCRPQGAGGAGAMLLNASGPPSATANAKAPLDKQGLEDFLSVLGQKRLFVELEALERSLGGSAVTPLSTLLQSEKQWLVDLDYLTKSIDDEIVFTQTIGNLSYLSAWEVSEKRCNRYSEKLNASLSRYSFDRLSYQVDLWSLNCEDRELVSERIQRLVQIRLKIANNCSERQWLRDLCGDQLSRDIIKMTLIYIKQYRNNLGAYLELYTGLQSDLSECEAAINSEVATKNSKIEIINRWKDTVGYFAGVLHDLQKRDEWLKNKIQEWREEGERLKVCVQTQKALLANEISKSERIKKIIFSLNVYRERSLLIDEWSLAKLQVDSAQGLVKLKLSAAGDLSWNMTNPVMLVDSTVWLQPEGLKQNADIAAMRRKAIETRYKNITLIDSILLAANPWELELRLKVSQLPFVKSLKLGNRELNWAEVIQHVQECTAQDENLGGADGPRHQSADNDQPYGSTIGIEAKHSVLLFSNILKILGAALRDMLVATFGEIRQSASIDDLGGIAWCLASNAGRLAVEILAIWHDFSAFSEGVLRVDKRADNESASAKFRIYIERSGDSSPKLTTRIPVPVKNRLDIMTLRFDLFAAIHGGGLFAGFEHADKLSAEELSNVRAELRRKSRDLCGGCAVSAVSHSVAMADVLSRLIPFMIKRSSSET